MHDELYEPVAVPDVYVDDIAKVEFLGTNLVRVTYCAKIDGRKAVALRMIRRIDSIRGELRRLVIEAITHEELSNSRSRQLQ